eukprot:TCALIF_05856-PA protein Name:"Protein of unknown function" AED:0.05 eAED:0.05 QI:70/0/1/1/1/1/2/201/134
MNNLLVLVYMSPFLAPIHGVPSLLKVQSISQDSDNCAQKCQSTVSTQSCSELVLHEKSSCPICYRNIISDQKEEFQCIHAIDALATFNPWPRVNPMACPRVKPMGSRVPSIRVVERWDRELGNVETRVRPVRIE